jgi:hypothetical protein
MKRLLVCAAMAVVLSGCDGGAEPTKVKVEDRLLGNTNPGDRASIGEHLKKANVNGAIVSIEEKPDHWVVDVGEELGKNGKRGMPRPPTSYRVNRADGAVKKM